jgi:hypothetical protein
MRERIRMVMQSYSEDGGTCYRLISCDLSGDDLESVVLQTPESESGECSLFSFCISEDNNVYAVKREMADMFASCLQEGSSIVSGDTDGMIRFEIKLDPLDFEEYDNPNVLLRRVSKNGEFILYVSDYKKAIMAHASSDGKIISITDSQMSGTAFSPLVNQDEFQGWRFSVKNPEGEYDDFYMIYDIETRSFSESVPIYNDLESTYIYGTTPDTLILYNEGDLFKYYPFRDKIEPFAQIREDAKFIYDVETIGDDGFMIYFKDHDDTDYPYEGVYIYTLLNE